MASLVSIDVHKCQGIGCLATSNLTYYANEENTFCPNCAPEVKGYVKAGPKVEGYVKTEPIVKSYVKTEPTGEWFCSKHEENCKFYCQQHGIALCVQCPLTGHRPCQLRGLEDVIQENREILFNLRDRLVIHGSPDIGPRIEQFKIDADDHIKKMKTDVNLVFSEAIKTNTDSEKEDATKIKEEIDERNAKLREEIQRIEIEIERNLEERERRLDQSHAMSEGRQSAICNEHSELFGSILNIAEKIGQKIAHLERSWKEMEKSEEEVTKLLNATLQGGAEAIVQETKRVETSVTAVLGKQLDGSVFESINHTTSGARFVKHEGNERYIGKIVERGQGWKHVDSIKVTDPIKEPIIVGYTGGGKVIITDSSQGGKDTYTLNTVSKDIERVIPGCDASYVVSCASLTDGKVACGRYINSRPARSLAGCICVYDSQWKLINSISKPRDKKENPTMVYVAADPNGMIVACELGQKQIYVIDPADGNVINIIEGIDTMALRGVQSSGHIVAQTSLADKRVFFIERENVEDEIIHDDLILNVGVDLETDDLYVVTSESECLRYVIQTLSQDDDADAADKQNDRIEFPLCCRLIYLGNNRMQTKTRNTHLETSRMILISSMKLIACDGDSILLYQK